MPPPPPFRSALSAAAILQKLGKLVRSIAKKKGVPAQDFEEVSQRVGVDLVLYPHNIPPESQLRPWLRVVVKRKIAQYFREYPRRWVYLSSGGADIRTETPSPEEQLLSAQMRALVSAEVERLEPERRAVWILREDEGKTSAEIAAITGIAVGTVDTRYRLAREDLCAALRRREREERRKRREGAFLLLLFSRAWHVLSRPRGSRPAFARPDSARPAFARCLAATCLLCALIPWHALHRVSTGFAAVAGAIEGQNDPSFSLNFDSGKPLRIAGVGLAAKDGPPLAGAPRDAASGAPPAVALPKRPALAAKALPARSLTAPSGPATEPREKFRDIMPARAWLDRAQRAARSGQIDAARAALRAYDAYAPDNPLAAARTAVLEAIDAASKPREQGGPGR